MALEFIGPDTGEEEEDAEDEKEEGGDLRFRLVPEDIQRVSGTVPFMSNIFRWFEDFFPQFPLHFSGNLRKLRVSDKILSNPPPTLPPSQNCHVSVT